MVKRLQPGARQMRRGIKIGIAVAGIVVVLPVVAYRHHRALCWRVAV